VASFFLGHGVVITVAHTDAYVVNMISSDSFSATP